MPLGHFISECLDRVLPLIWAYTGPLWLESHVLERLIVGKQCRRRVLNFNVGLLSQIGHVSSRYLTAA